MRQRAFSLSLCILILLALAGGSVWAAPAAQTDALNAFAFDARADVELLANLVLGDGVRPDTWTFNADIASSTFIADLWFDNEQLANDIFGVDLRPADWFGT